MMKSNKAYKLRIYPTKEQAILLKQISGNCRWLWNHLLADNQNNYNKIKKFFFYKDMSASLPNLKQEIDWLGMAPAVSLQRVAKNLDTALKQCFKLGKGFPQFKKKSDNKDSFYLTNQVFKIKGLHQNRKAHWYGKHIVKIGRFEPSSQACSCCGYKQKMSLDKRTYECPSCGMKMDRDLNAAINIRNWGMTKVGQGMSEPIGENQSTPVDDTSAEFKSLVI